MNWLLSGEPRFTNEGAPTVRMSEAALSISNDSDGFASMERADVPDAACGEAIRRLLKRLPQWLRADLISVDALQCERAEDALFAMTMACPGAANSPQAGEAS